MTESIAPPATAKPETKPTKELTKAAVSGWLGTAMEFMDFQLYSLAAAIVFNKIFFPNVSPAIGLIAAMATYGVGYVARLAGAIYFGRMGDRIGRKKVLFITIALMGASTTLIGVLPTYAMIGIAAPILLVALRLVQGFGAGAEIAGATVMLAEYAPAKRRGVIASLVSLGTNSGTLAASALWAFLLGVLSEEQLLSWGWRLPFLLSFVLLIFAVWLRLNLKESPVFEERPDVVDGVALSRRETGRGRRRRDSTLEAGLKQRKGKAFFLALGLRFGQAGNSGLVQTFLVGYIATALLVSKSVPTQAIVWGSLLGFVTVPIVGLLGDRFGRRPVYIALTPLTIAARLPAAADDHQRQHPGPGARHGHRAEHRRAGPVLAGERDDGGAVRLPHPVHPARAGQGDRRHPGHRDRPGASPPRSPPSPAVGGRSPRCSSSTR